MAVLVIAKILPPKSVKAPTFTSLLPAFLLLCEGEGHVQVCVNSIKGIE